MELIYRHHIIKLSRSILCRLNLLHICVLIIDSLLYRQQNATKITLQHGWHKTSVRFDRLSHLITTLKHWEQGESGGGGEYALDSCSSKRVSVLNIFKALCFENIILYFFRLVKTHGFSEIEVTTGFKETNFEIQKEVCVWNFLYQPCTVQIEMNLYSLQIRNQVLWYIILDTESRIQFLT